MADFFYDSQLEPEDSSCQSVLPQHKDAETNNFINRG